MAGYKHFDEYEIGAEFYEEYFCKKESPNFREYNKIIEIDKFPQYFDWCQLIICAPTNIWIESQVGGHACHHPSIEGFVIDCPKYWAGIDDCEMGCHLIGDGKHKELQLEVANVIQKDFEETQTQLIPMLHKLSVNENIKLNFDFERINELEESWWPVIVDWNGQK